jgi:hypothetical protein
MGQRQTKSQKSLVEIKKVDLLGGTLKYVATTLDNGDKTVACFDNKNILILFYVNDELCGYREKSGNFHVVGLEETNEDPGMLS